MLDFQVSTIVFTVINLLVLYFILRKLLFGRVNAVLEQRAARVKETIDSAEASKCQAEELRAEYEDKLTEPAGGGQAGGRRPEPRPAGL